MEWTASLSDWLSDVFFYQMKWGCLFCFFSPCGVEQHVALMLVLIWILYKSYHVIHGSIQCKISNNSLPSRKGTSLIPSCTRNFTPTLLHQRQRCFYGRNTIALTSTRVCSSSVAAAAWIDAIQAGKHEWQRWFINGADVCCIHAHVLTILDDKHTCKLRGRQQRLLPLRCTSLCRWVHKQTMKEWVKGRARGVIHHTTPCDSGQPYTETRHPHHRQTDIQTTSKNVLLCENKLVSKLFSPWQHI